MENLQETQKENQRDELHKTIWKIANDLRGSIDGWDFKQYVLGAIFYRYLSEYFTNFINKNEHEARNLNFDYAKLKDNEIPQKLKDDLIKTKGFYIKPSELFENTLRNLKDENFKENLNENLSKIFKNIESSSYETRSENDFKGLFSEFDLNSSKLGTSVINRNEKLAQLLSSVAEMNLCQNFEDNTIDTFGDAYEYLMKMYASNAGKSGGEFFTPQEVSFLLAKIAIDNKTQINKAYDPACGSGSLLLQIPKILGKNGIANGLFGQEINLTTYNLCRMNMFLHNMPYEKFDIALGDTLINPLHDEFEPFEVIVSNPPYGIKWKGDSDPILINDERYSKAGILAPKSKADFAFIMHSLSYLSSNGTAAIVCFPGIFYRGGAEQKIRKYLIDQNLIHAVIALPENIFFGTSIATCILVIKKGKLNDTNVQFIDASNEFIKVTNSNKLTNQNIENILKFYEDRKDIDFISKIVSNEKIAENDYNLSVSSYVEKKDEREKIDINELNNEIKICVANQTILREKIDKIIAWL